MLPDKQFLIDLAHTKMPFGKYKDRYLIDLPEYYVVWYNQKGFPKGKLGDMLKQVYKIKRLGSVDTEYQEAVSEVVFLKYQSRGIQLFTLWIVKILAGSSL